MRLPGAALLIAIGLLILWVAITGRLDKLGEAWTFIKGESDSLPIENINNTMPGAGAHSDSVSSASRLTNPDVWHTNTMSLALQPSVSLFNPGGIN